MNLSKSHERCQPTLSVFRSFEALSSRTWALPFRTSSRHTIQPHRLYPWPMVE
jgi:hypothetical protein